MSIVINAAESQCGARWGSMAMGPASHGPAVPGEGDRPVRAEAASHGSAGGGLPAGGAASGGIGKLGVSLRERPAVLSTAAESAGAGATGFDSAGGYPPDP